VRRLLNISGHFGPSGSGLLSGPARDWAAQLAELALAEGISTFILATDDPETIRRYAIEVVPAVRELVASGRAGSPVRPAANGAPHGTAPASTSAPDDVTQLSGIRRWDEATRPTAPREASGHSSSGGEAKAALVGAHNLLREELSTLRDLIADVRKGTLDPGQARSALSQLTMRQNNWSMGAYCESYCRLVTRHHALEDQAVFPHLRASEPALGPVLDRLRQEHATIHEVLDAVDRALVAFMAKPDALAGPQDIVDVLTDTLLSHLAYEERELLDPLGRHGFY
jgi:hypothetical protein